MMKKAAIDLHGTGAVLREVYHMRPSEDGEYWPAVTSYPGAEIPCPVARCGGVIEWFENGHVPGYRKCDGEQEHRFQAAGTASDPTLQRDHEREPTEEEKT